MRSKDNTSVAATAAGDKTNFGPDTPSDSTGYLRRPDAAKYLGISQRTLSEWQRKRVIPFVKVGARCCLFKRDELDRAMIRFTIEAVGGAK